MCGMAGFITGQHFGRWLSGSLSRMLYPPRMRGPENEGQWTAHDSLWKELDFPGQRQIAALRSRRNQPTPLQSRGVESALHGPLAVSLLWKPVSPRLNGRGHAMENLKTLQKGAGRSKRSFMVQSRGR